VIEKRGKILFVNPGSAGPRRFSLPLTVATLALRPGRCEAKIVELALCQQSQKPGRSNRSTGMCEEDDGVGHDQTITRLR
jgi:hypothetical protein